jgi:DNA polymerase-4
VTAQASSRNRPVPEGRPALKGKDLVGAGQVAQQISLDTAREARLVAQAAIHRIRDKYGPGIIGPGAALRRAS